MSFSYKVNYSDTQDDNLLPEGDYEIFVKRAEFAPNTNGKDRIHMEMQIRSDVQQQYKNRRIFADLWFTSEAAAQISMRQMNAISKACAVPDNKDYSDLNEWCGEIIGKFMKVHVRIRKQDGYDPQNQVSAYRPSAQNYPAGEIDGYNELERPMASRPAFKPVSNDDLPF